MRSTAVRAYLQIAPWWVWSVINCLLFAGLMTVFGWIDYPRSEHRLRLVVINLALGVVVGALMGPIAVRQRRGVAAVAGDLSNDDLLVARRAARRGPVPLDREIRLAAARLADFQLVSMVRQRVLATIVSVAFAAFLIWNATTSPRWWIVVGPLLGLFAAALLMPGHLRRRLALLTADVGAG